MADNTRQPYTTLLPKKVLSKVESLTVTEAGWAAGPSFVVRKTEYFTPYASFSQALAWFERYRHLFRACHFRFSNASVLWMSPISFLRYDRDDRRLREATGGLEVSTGKGDVSVHFNFEEVDREDAEDEG